MNRRDCINYDVVRENLEYLLDQLGNAWWEGEKSAREWRSPGTMAKTLWCTSDICGRLSFNHARPSRYVGHLVVARDDRGRYYLDVLEITGNQASIPVLGHAVTAYNERYAFPYARRRR